MDESQGNQKFHKFYKLSTSKIFSSSEGTIYTLVFVKYTKTELTATLS